MVFLQANQPDYRNLEIDKDNLLALPEDGPITEQLPACEVNEPFFPNLGNIPNGQELPNADLNELDDKNQPPQTAVMALTQATRPVDFNILSMASVTNNPISERDLKPVFGMAFPACNTQGQMVLLNVSFE